MDIPEAPTKVAEEPVARYLEISGVVQGVGFRPFVYKLAQRHGARGWVRNTSAGVQIHIEGSAASLALFIEDLRSKAPPLARIESVACAAASPQGHRDFAIIASLSQDNAYQLVSPDVATCHDCTAEIFDSEDRRFGYPFTNCTNCGPRFTIIEDIPYDRPLTTMRDFQMCPSCQREYDDPVDRRFHAQPNACPDCGPHLSLVESRDSGLASLDAQLDDSAIIREAAERLATGQILAIKGLGGFHLACDATNEGAVLRLRERKHRPHKPFAVMIADLDLVRQHCSVNAEEQNLLQSVASPIVLLPWLPRSSIVKSVAPDNRYLGVMLPYTPLHHLLLAAAGRPLVMTSGNCSEEPIVTQNDEAMIRLGPLADGFVLHNRDIHSRYDDSVWFVPIEGLPQPVRRARGYAPSPLRVSFPLGRILAAGAELKSTFCLTRDQYAFVSQHIGDMENLETLAHYEETIALYERLFRASPEALVCDLHPDYMTTRYAMNRAQNEGLPLLQVQHHHAHVVSCLADNNCALHDGPVIGVAMDGTGYGTDGHIWGGECFIADARAFQRVAHLEYMPLPGGDAATRKPYRAAIAYLLHSLGEVPSLPALRDVPVEEAAVIAQMVQRGVNTPLTSSCGRLFDVVSALLGLRLEITYEAQAAVDLEMVSAGASAMAQPTYQFDFRQIDGVHTVRLHDVLAGIVADIKRGLSASEIGVRFHATVAHMITQMCQEARSQSGLDRVALSGGCFQNRLLLSLARSELRSAGFQVLVHHQVPCNDGGLSLGQAVIGSERGGN